jgi:hypothetical protein
MHEKTTKVCSETSCKLFYPKQPGLSSGKQEHSKHAPGTQHSSQCDHKMLPDGLMSPVFIKRCERIFHAPWFVLRGP